MTREDASFRERSHRDVIQVDSSRRLPVEILCGIFQIAGQRGLDLHTNLDIAAVCSFWRDVAHGYPWMWTCIQMKRPDYPPREVVESLVERSRLCPLEIYCEVPMPTWLSDLVYANINRLTVLRELHVSEGDARPGLPAPTLENLRVVYTGGPAGLLSRIPTISDAPRLNTLDMMRCRFPWHSPFYRNLVDLSILTLDPSQDDDILEIPHASPNLQRLVIHFLDSPLHGVPPRYHSLPSTALRMHALHTLELTLRDVHALRLFSGMILPEHMRRVGLSLHCHNPGSLDTLLGFRYLPSRFFADLRGLKLSSRSTVSGHDFINWKIAIDGEGYTPQSATYRLKLRIAYSGRFPQQPCDIRRLLPSHTEMPLLQHLRLYECQPRAIEQSADALACILVRAPALVRLGLQGEGFLSRFESLHRTLLEATAPPFNSALPRLERIDIDMGDGTARSPRAYNDADKFADVIPLLQLFQPHLREVHIDVPQFQHEGDDDALVRIVEGFRGLDVPEIWWNTPFHRGNVSRGSRRTYAKELWPKGEPYTWRCRKESEHGEDMPLWLKCEFCGTPLRLPA